MRSVLVRCTLALLMLGISNAQAHFQTIIPSADIVDHPEQRTLALELQFTHPMNRGPTMEMAKPRQFGVINPAGQQNLLDTLKPFTLDGKTAYRSQYMIHEPGDHIFFVEPSPYWEPAEQKMIVHYAKVVVDAYAGDSMWQQTVGFPVEIDPLTRPYGLWTGNQFQGVVLQQGQPVPFANIEVEWLNDGSFSPPADAFVTQQLKADANGTFSYVMPRAGWWGFAALFEGSEPIPGTDEQSVNVEQGAIIWVYSRDMK